MRAPARILVLGGGHVGLNAADRLRRRLRPGEAELTLADPVPSMTYQPLVPEVAVGNVEARHVAIPLRRALPGVHIVTGQAITLSHADRTARVRLTNGEERDLGYDHVAVAIGSVVRTSPIPGLAELAVGFRTLGEAIFLRNRVLTQLSLAASTADPQTRHRALTFVVVGGWFTGVSVVGELSDLAMDAITVFDELHRADLHWILVESGTRVLPSVSPELSEYTARVLRERGVEIRLNTSITSCVAGRIRFGPGPYSDEVVEADTLIWTADIRPNPMLCHTDLPLDGHGRVLADAYLRVRGRPRAWTAGDCAAVPDLTNPEPGALCLPTAEHASAQGRRLADNLIADMRHERRRPPRPYRHRYAGAAAGLGRKRGVAEFHRVRLSGLPAWLWHRGYHLAKMPSDVHKARVFTDWALDALFSRDINALIGLEEPRKPLQAVARAPVPAVEPGRRL